MSSGFPHTGFNPLQCRNAFAPEVSFSGPRQNGLRSKTVLNPERIFHDPFQSFLLSFCHVSKIINNTNNRKFILVEIKTARTFVRAVVPQFLLPGDFTRRST
jgi:hypothetical protein